MRFLALLGLLAAIGFGGRVFSLTVIDRTIEADAAFQAHHEAESARLLLEHSKKRAPRQ